MLHMLYTVSSVCKFITVIFPDLFYDVCIENFFSTVCAMKSLLPMIDGCCQNGNIHLTYICIKI